MSIKLLSVTVCVNYSDYLAECLPHNSKIIDKMIVVTDENDHDTIKCCEKFSNVEVLISDKLHKNKLTFNKSALINHALNVFGHESEWVLILDADIRINSDFRQSLNDLDINNLYGVQRKIYVTKQDYENKNVIEGQECGVGYFQLFNTKSKPWLDNVRYTESRTGRIDNHNFKNADSWFAGNWPIKPLPGVTVDHLGHYRVNWSERKSEKWQNT